MSESTCTHGNTASDHSTPLTGLTLESFPKGMHACMFFDEVPELQMALERVMRGFFKDQRAVAYFGDRVEQSQVESMSCACGSNHDQFSYDRMADLYQARESLDPAVARSALKATQNAFKERGYDSTMMMGEMSWARDRCDTWEDVLKFESSINELIEGQSFCSICTYRASDFTGEFVMGVMRTHPYTIIGGQVFANPHYVPHKQLYG